MNNIYKLHYIENELNGFYSDEIHGSDIPEPCIAINEDLWQELLKKEYRLRDFKRIPKKDVFELNDLYLFEEVVREPEPYIPTQTDLRLESLENENADLLIDAAIKDAKIELLENDLADLMIEIASMGGIK